MFLESLLGDEQRKTGWMRAEAAGDPGPWRQQAILGRRDWDADALRDIVRDYVIEHLADDDAVLVIDETGFLKQGKASCGVARQYTGSAGTITNCQIGVFAAYVSCHGHAFIDRALYLPKEWTDDPDRLEAAYVPPDTGFATKPKLATRMIARAIAASVPFKWVAGDTVYGVGDIEQQLRKAVKGYVLGVSSAHVFRSWGKRRPVAGTAADIAQTRRPSDWKRLSAGAGTKGPRLHDWCYLELADLEVEESNDPNPGLWTRGLLIRRRIADGDFAFFTTWCPVGTSIETLVCARCVRCWPSFPLVPGLGSAGSVTGRPALFARFAATMPESDFSGSCISGYGSSPSRCGPGCSVSIWPTERAPGSRTRSFCTCQGLRPRRNDWALAISHPFVLPSAQLTASALGKTFFRGSMAGLCTPLPTLRRHPHGCLRTARGRCGSLFLHRSGLPPPTPCRSPGAPTVMLSRTPAGVERSDTRTSLSELRVFRGDRHVAYDVDDMTAADRIAIDGADYRFRDVADDHVQVIDFQKHVFRGPVGALFLHFRS